MSSEEVRVDPKPANAVVDYSLIEPWLVASFQAAGDDDLLQAALDGRLTWKGDPFDESGYRHNTVSFGDEQVAVARLHWSDLT
jgi:hypothetical protein